MTTELTTAEICAIITLTGEAAPKRPNSKGVAVGALKRAIRTAIPNADADRAAAAILGAATREHAEAIFWKIEAEFNPEPTPAPEPAPTVADEAPILPPRKSRMAALTVIEAAAPAPAPKTPRAPKVAAPAAAPAPQIEGLGKLTGKYKDQGAIALLGILPPEPDFSAATHKAYRGKLADLSAKAAARDLDGLRATETRPYDSSMAALNRYRLLCIIALEAQTTQATAA